MRLFIAEKPSLAAAIAAQLPGNAVKSRTHIEVGNDVVTWCVGHILEQFMPEDYDPSLKRWSAATLPIAPREWKLKIKDGMQAQVKAIGDLLKRADTVVNAGDPDREGQLLVDEVLHYLNNKKPVMRVLVNDYNEGPVRKALANIRPNSEPQFHGWYASALARSRFDWLFGLNLTRAYTIAAQEKGYEGVLTVGRVQTPTLGLVVARDLAIENFKPIPFYTIAARIQHKNGTFAANWRPKEGQAGLDKDGRLVEHGTAFNLAMRLNGGTAQITRYSKAPANERAPLPFSLSTLQMEANDKYGYTGQQVLDVCQELYETHKLTTYPRTDCNYLSEAQHADGAAVIASVIANRPDLAAVSKKANLSRKSAAFDDSKVTAHHAIVPTTRRIDLANLPAPSTKGITVDMVRNIYDMVVRTYLAQFFPPSQYMKTEIEVTTGGEVFTAKGKTPVSQGWREIYAPPEPDKENGGDDDTEDDRQALPTMAEGDYASCVECKAIERKTTAPARFTDKLLLAAMLNIHKYVDDPAAKARLKEGQGIGTEATRAGIIEELKKRGFIAPFKSSKKQLVSTPAGRALIAALPTHAKNPALTGICEQALDLVSAGKLTADSFIERNMQLIARLVSDARTANLNVPVAPSVPCPQCRSGKLRMKKGTKGNYWSCSNWNADPKCEAIYSDAAGKPNIYTPVACPQCNGGTLHKRSNAYGTFWSCSNWNADPKCEARFSDLANKPNLNGPPPVLAKKPAGKGGIKSGLKGGLAAAKKKATAKKVAA